MSLKEERSPPRTHGVHRCTPEPMSTQLGARLSQRNSEFPDSAEGPGAQAHGLPQAEMQARVNRRVCHEPGVYRASCTDFTVELPTPPEPAQNRKPGGGPPYCRRRSPSGRAESPLPPVKPALPLVRKPTSTNAGPLPDATGARSRSFSGQLCWAVMGPHFELLLNLFKFVLPPSF